jgi:hypothetical protein
LYRNNLATVLVEAGRPNEAFAQLAATSEPAVAHYNLGYLLHQRGQSQPAADHLQRALLLNPSLSPASQLLAEINGPAAATDLVVEMPPLDAPQNVAPVSAPGPQEVYVAQGEQSGLVNPLVPTGRRAPTYRMPPVEEQADDPAPQPTRLPVIVEPNESTVPAEESPTVVEPTVPAPGPYPATQTSHSEDPIRQPKNVIRLLGVEPQSAPIPTE